MKYFLLLVFIVLDVFGQNVEVSAKKFSANEAEGKSEFFGNVVVKKGNDILKANKLIIYFNDKRKPTKYKASGNAELSVEMDKKNYFAKGDTLVYLPFEKVYTVEGKAFLFDKTTNKKVYGNFVKIDQNNGLYEVDSKGKGPVKFIFQVEDK